MFGCIGRILVCAVLLQSARRKQVFLRSCHTVGCAALTRCPCDSTQASVEYTPYDFKMSRVPSTFLRYRTLPCACKKKPGSAAEGRKERSLDVLISLELLITSVLSKDRGEKRASSINTCIVNCSCIPSKVLAGLTGLDQSRE